MIDEHGKLHGNIHPQAGGVYTHMVEVPTAKLDALKELSREQRHPTQLRARTPQELATRRQQQLVDAKEGRIIFVNKQTGKMIEKSLGSLESANDTAILDAIKTEIVQANTIRRQVNNATTIDEVNQVPDNRKP